MKYRIIAKLKSGKDVIGYRLGLEGGKQLDLPKNQVHSLAFQEEIINAKFNRSTKSLTGANGTDLRKIDTINIDNKCNQERQLPIASTNKSNHMLAKSYDLKQRVISQGNILKFRYLEDDRVMLTDVENKKCTGKLIIPSFVTDIEIRTLTYNKSSPLRWCNFTEIFVDNQPGRWFNADNLCSDMNSATIKLSFRHPECIKSMEKTFSRCTSTTHIDISDIQSTSLENTIGMFEYCSNLKSINFGNFCTDNVVNMSSMFKHCESLTSLDLSTFNTSKVEDMSFLFNECKNLHDINLSEFDTSNVVIMISMFKDCYELQRLDLSSFNTSNTVSMKSMFSRCYSLEQLDLSSFDTTSVVELTNMFGDCNSIKQLDLYNFITPKLTSTRHMFGCCKSLEKLRIDNIDFSNVTDMAYMFERCKSLKVVCLGNVKLTKRLKDTSYIFDGCKTDEIQGIDKLINNLNKLDLYL